MNRGHREERSDAAIQGMKVAALRTPGWLRFARHDGHGASTKCIIVHADGEYVATRKSGRGAVGYRAVLS
jgi:hypothetical protein